VTDEESGEKERAERASGAVEIERLKRVARERWRWGKEAEEEK